MSRGVPQQNCTSWASPRNQPRGNHRFNRKPRGHNFCVGSPSSDILTSMSVNKAILVGRLGRDPETRFTSGGQAVANFTMATDETFKDRSGERQKRTEWHRIVVWGKLAEITQQYLKKGMLVYIEGRIQTRQWEDKRDGQKKTTTEIVANVMRMLTSKAEGAAAGAGGSAPSQGRSADADFEGATLPDDAAPMGPEISDE